MSFMEVVDRWQGFDYAGFFEKVSPADIQRALVRPKLDEKDLLALLSPLAQRFLEPLAARSKAITQRQFGRCVQLFAPLYIANHCVNRCIYCGFNIDNRLERAKLTTTEIEREVQALYRQGIRHVLLLTGESQSHSPLAYLEEAIGIAKRYFSSVGIEIYPLPEEGYRRLIRSGADSLTLYQETYDRQVYRSVHLAGPKRNYQNRLDAPENGAKAGMRSVSIGALLGLSEFRPDFFMACLHAAYLQKRYPGTDIGISTPRIRPHAGAPCRIYPVEDRDIVQLLCASRLFLPRAVFTMTTRESASFRNHTLPLGVTKLSAGVHVGVGGYSASKSYEQFEIADIRSVQEVSAHLRANGFDPVYQDWVKEL